MCTLARLVQGATASEWYSMPMKDSSLTNTSTRLRSGEPAYVEVTIDPAAHGDAGLGPMQRSVLLQTESGQRIQLDLTAEVVR